MIKRSLTVVAVLLMSLSAFAQSNFTIKGKLGGLHDAKIYIGFSYDGKAVYDSVYFNHGAFEMIHPLPYPVMATLSVSKDGDAKTYFEAENVIRVYVEPGSVIWISSIDETIGNADVSGSKTNDDYKTYQSFMTGINRKLDALTQEATHTNGKQDSANRRLYMEKFRATMEERRAQMKAFISQNREMYISIDILEEYAGRFINYADVEPLYSSLSTDVQITPKGKAFLKKLNEAKQTAVGAMAPDFTQRDQNGNKVSLSSFKGKNVLLVFWASWSNNARTENHDIFEMMKEFKGSNITVVAIALEDRKDAWLEAIQQDATGWIQLSDLKYLKNEVADMYDVRAVPQNVLIDATGRIIARNLHGSELKAKLSSLK